MMRITVETVQHGFALSIENKSWLLADERKLTEALAYQVSVASESRVSKQRMQRVMNTIAYGMQRRRKIYKKPFRHLG